MSIWRCILLLFEGSYYYCSRSSSEMLVIKQNMLLMIFLHKFSLIVCGVYVCFYRCKLKYFLINCALSLVKILGLPLSDFRSCMHPGLLLGALF